MFLIEYFNEQILAMKGLAETNPPLAEFMIFFWMFQGALFIFGVGVISITSYILLKKEYINGVKQRPLFYMIGRIYHLMKRVNRKCKILLKKNESI